MDESTVDTTPSWIIHGMGEAPQTPFHSSRPFSRADARGAGIPVRRLSTPAYQRIFHDVYVAATVEVTPVLRATIALSHCHAGAFASLETAAELWGLWVPPSPDTHVSVARGGVRTKRRGVKVHLANPAARVVLHGGLPVTDPVQTYLDLARRLPLVDLVTVGDSILRRDLASARDLVEAAARWHGHGARLARRAAGYVRAGVDSPMETRLRMLVVLGGLPEPVVNLELLVQDGRRRVRLDLAYPRWRTALEYDGRHHAESDRQWQGDIDRREQLDRIDWRMLIVRAPGLWVHPHRTLTRVVDTLSERGARGVRVRGDEWRRHFPGRPAIA